MTCQRTLEKEHVWCSAPRPPFPNPDRQGGEHVRMRQVRFLTGAVRKDLGATWPLPPDYPNGLIAFANAALWTS